MKQFIIIYLVCLLAGFNMQALAGHPMPNEDKHGTVDVPENVKHPRLSIQLYKDMMSGFNLHISTQYFQLEAPEFSKDLPEEGVQGHAHLYINNKKIGRLYAPYAHIPGSLLEEGLNVIAVTINDHHHNTWRYQEKEIIAAIVLDTRKEQPVMSMNSPYPVEEQ